MTQPFKLHHGDCIEVMRAMPDNSVDAVVTDPPYGIRFMGKAWDGADIEARAAQRRSMESSDPSATEFGAHNSIAAEAGKYDLAPAAMKAFQEFSQAWAAEALRVLKPGGHLLSFASARTYHRMAAGIEDAGFEIRDQIMWVYSSGFPKSHNLSGERQGWGTALKPSFEPLCVAHKPLSTETEQDIIIANLFILERRLWSLLLVSAVETSSTSNQSELSVVCAIAQWSVDEAISTRDALCEVMGTSQFELATNTSLNIVSSWRRTLDELSKVGSMSITKMKSSTTTDWKTLNFCLSQITLRTIILASLGQFGLAAFASTAERYFDAELKRLQCTLELSALGTAISQDRLNSLDVDEKVKHEPICVARKPLVGTVAANVLAFGTGAINIDGCRVPIDPSADASQLRTMNRGVRDSGDGWGMSTVSGDSPSVVRQEGRWPANLLHDGSAEVVALFPQAKSGGSVKGTEPSSVTNGIYGEFEGRVAFNGFGDTGSAARFFYCAKASRADRNEGLASGNTPAVSNGATMRDKEDANWSTRNGNSHPTVKPTELMAYLCRLVTPPNGVVLDPFMGSGSTGKAAIREGFTFIGIEREQEYIDIARARIKHACRVENDSQVQQNMELF